MGLAEAADLLGVDPSTLRAQVHRGRLRAYKVGRDWLLTDEEIDRYRREVQGQRAPRKGR